jgi:hypothetical protein
MTQAQIVEEPSEVVSLLANSLPQQALFFIIFIMVQGIGRLSFQLFRFVRLIRCAVKWCLLARPITPSEVPTHCNTHFPVCCSGPPPHLRTRRAQNRDATC